jgi:hypothetical protein
MTMKGGIWDDFLVTMSFLPSISWPFQSFDCKSCFLSPFSILIEGKSYGWGLAKKPGFLYFLANHPQKVKTTKDPCPWKKFMINGLIPILPGGKRHER